MSGSFDIHCNQMTCLVINIPLISLGIIPSLKLEVVFLISSLADEKATVVLRNKIEPQLLALACVLRVGVNKLSDDSDRLSVQAAAAARDGTRSRGLCSRLS